MAFPNSSARKPVFLFESSAPSLAPTGGIKRQGAPVKRSLGGANPPGDRIKSEQELSSLSIYDGVILSSHAVEGIS